MAFSSLDEYSRTKFDKDIVVDCEHCPAYINKSSADPEEIAFTVHVPFQQLKSWYDNKSTVLRKFSYVEVLNAFIGKRYPIQLNCATRLEEVLRVICASVAHQFIGKSGKSYQTLLQKVKRIAVRKNELFTVSSLKDLEHEIGRLEKANASMRSQNVLLQCKYNDSLLLVNKTQAKIDKAYIEIDKLKQENQYLYNTIEKIAPHEQQLNNGNDISELSKRQQERKLRTLETKIEQALWFSESFGLHLDLLLDDHLHTGVKRIMMS